MSGLADAHIHLFEGGYGGGSLASRPGVRVDEARCYQSLADEHGVGAALVVGYAGQSWCAGNNAFVARLRPRFAWLRPLAYVPLDGSTLSVEQLRRWRDAGFVGISLYPFEASERAALAAIDERIWAWLVERGWLVSVNAGARSWADWEPVLEAHGDLRVLVSHLGLPPRRDRPPSRSEAASSLAAVTALARFPGPRVKLSGYYALTEPGHDYPHEAAWPYTQVLLDAFGASRLLWASDFSPCMDSVTFPQTYDLFSKMAFLSDGARQAILGGNLRALLAGAA